MVKRLRHRPFTAVTRVRISLGSLVLIINHNENLQADVAQLAEQLICNQQVIGSSPIIGFGPYVFWMYWTLYMWTFSSVG